MYQNSKQRLDLHELLLGHTLSFLSSRMQADAVSVSCVAQSGERERDFEISTETFLGDPSTTIVVESKTETKKSDNLLCLEIAANIIAPLDIPRPVLSPFEAKAYKDKALSFKPPADPKLENRGFVLTPKTDSHLFASWNQHYKRWTLWNSSKLCAWVREEWDRWDVTFGRNWGDYGHHWYSICVLIPVEIAMSRPGLVACYDEVDPLVFTESYCQGRLTSAATTALPFSPRRR